jgi:hypothetical protein
MGEENTYYGGAVITGIIAFIGIWIYAISQWGLLFGLLFGWLPAIIGGFIAGVLWPLIAIIIIILLFMAYGQ